MEEEEEKVEGSLGSRERRDDKGKKKK